MLFLEEINFCGNDLVQMELTGFIDISVTAEAVFREDKLHFSIFIAHKVAAGAAYRTFKWELDTIPVGLAFEYKRGMAIWT